MKKYIITISVLIFVFLVYNFLCFNLGFYIPLKQDKIETEFIVKDKKLMHDGKEFNIRGVNVGTSAPGLFTTDYNISKKTYYNWIKQIKEMNANTIRVDTIVNDNFYDALYEYNSKHDDPIYLLQGILIQTYPLNNRNDAYVNDYYDALVKNSKLAVDVIHGRRKIFSNTSDVSSGNFNKDVSKWTIGYIINIEMDNNIIIYTNNRNSDLANFEGKFIKTSDKASGYEGLLARVFDALISYEDNKYKSHKIVSFENVPLTDPFDYSDEIRYHFKKATKLDINNIINKDKFKAGLIAAYQAYPYYFDYLNLNKTDNFSDTYSIYLKKLNEYHNYPFVVTRFGYSSSRGHNGIVTNNYGSASGLTEEEQGKSIVKAYDTIVNVGSSGAIIDEWSDNSNKSSYNTLKRVDTTRLPWWHDVQSSASGKGLLKFESGKDKTIVMLDGKLDDFNSKDKKISNEELDLYMKYDFKYMYFGVKLKDKNNDPLSIALDITNKSGSRKIDEYGIKTSKPTDFLIHIDGNESRIVVQSRYNTFKAIDHYEAYDRNPYLNIPEKDSSIFKHIDMLEQAFYKDLNYKYYEPIIYEAGKLEFGSTDKNNKNYNTLADYYSNGSVVEIRIPWVLLNFSDPTNLRIHDDYFKKYGVEYTDILNIYVGASKKNIIDMSKVKLSSVNNKIYHEELKDSYSIVKERWSK